MLDEEDQPYTLETALAAINHNADIIVSVAEQLREVRSENDRLRALVRESKDFMKDEHQSPRCDYFKVCHCGLDDLMQRLDAALGETK
jgi:hypothetical protein